MGSERNMSEARITTVGIIGAGTIGSSWAAYFLAHGLSVRCWDPLYGYAENVTSFVARAWPIMEQLGLAEGASLDKLACFDRVGEALDLSLIHISEPTRPY